ncbi:MAG: hypothetical protein V4549_06560 [Bacteroidota bacterium]
MTLQDELEYYQGVYVNLSTCEWYWDKMAFVKCKKRIDELKRKIKDDSK